MEFSGKHSFTLYPSLDPYRWTERQTESKYTRYAWAGGTFFQLCCCVSFLVVAEIVLGDTYLPYQLCRCVFFLLRREKHSFTLYPSLSLYWQTESRTERRMNCFGWRQPIWWWRTDYFYRQKVIWDFAGTGSTLFLGGMFWRRPIGWWRPDCDDVQTMISDLGGTGSTLFSGKLFWRHPIWWWRTDYFTDSRLSEIWWELAPHYFWEDCFGFFSDLKNFFGACFRYKLMYYNLYYVSDLRKIVRFLCKIECIEFECTKFVLVLVQINLIHFEHSNCISSTLTKTNTNTLHSRSIHSISRKIGHMIQIVVHQFVHKRISIFKLY